MLRNEFTLPPPLAALDPMRLDERPFDLNAPGWLFEIKYDGARLLAQFGSGKASFMTRNGADATKWFPEVAERLAAIPGGPHIVDGEVCVLDDRGRSDYYKLRARAKRRRWYGGADVATYCVFDLLVEHGVNLMSRPLWERKRRLAILLPAAAASLRYVDHDVDRGHELMAQAASLDLEGLVAKRADSFYDPGLRSADWVKIKRSGDQEQARRREQEVPTSQY
jgi:bifunctional non-homologous end joining protein LigD